MPPSRREDVIDAAMRVFYRHGFHASGLERILEEGGVSRMTLYNHFKSKDEVIVAALRRRDELFRNRMMKFVDSKATSPRDRLLAVFDFHESWFKDAEFCGCMFINACAEFSDPKSAPRLIAAEHKRAIVRYLCGICRECGLAHPESIADQLNILIEGAIVTAQVVDQVQGSVSGPGSSARLAREMARVIIDSAPMAQGAQRSGT